MRIESTASEINLINVEQLDVWNEALYKQGTMDFNAHIWNSAYPGIAADAAQWNAGPVAKITILQNVDKKMGQNGGKITERKTGHYLIANTL